MRQTFWVNGGDHGSFVLFLEIVVAVGEVDRRVHCVHVAEEVGELGLITCIGAGITIRPDPLQRADALGLFRQLLAMNVEDAQVWMVER